MERFSSIGQFRGVVKNVRQYHHRIGKAGKEPVMNFQGTVKLHGTNAGLRRSKSGKIQPQSRERIIGVTDDNSGFAQFIDNISDGRINQLFDQVGGGKDTTIYGEWVGKRIQGGTAVSKLDKHWVIFGAKVDNEYVTNQQEWRIEDDRVYNILGITPFYIAVDFKNPQGAVDELERLTLEVEERCPWAWQFGESGIGEGIVWKCEERMDDSDMWFKTKGTKHSGSCKEKKIVTVDPQLVASIEECMAIILPEERLIQGMTFLKENNLDADMKNMGKYLKWVGQDIKKEESDTIEANGLEWSNISKPIAQKAKTYFMDQVNKF